MLNTGITTQAGAFLGRQAEQSASPVPPPQPLLFCLLNRAHDAASAIEGRQNTLNAALNRLGAEQLPSGLDTASTNAEPTVANLISSLVVRLEAIAEAAQTHVDRANLTV